MDLSATALMVSLLVSCVGLGIFVYGKRQKRGPQLVIGFLLMVYPYFVSSTGLSVLIGAGLLVGLWVALRLGW
jgi:hypothetical protein